MNIKKLIFLMCMIFAMHGQLLTHGGQPCAQCSGSPAPTNPIMPVPGAQKTLDSQELSWLNTPTGFAFFLIVLAPIARTWSDVASDYIKERWINKKIKNRNRKETACCGGHSH